MDLPTHSVTHTLRPPLKCSSTSRMNSSVLVEDLRNSIPTFILIVSEERFLKSHPSDPGPVLPLNESSGVQFRFISWVLSYKTPSIVSSTILIVSEPIHVYSFTSDLRLVRVEFGYEKDDLGNGGCPLHLHVFLLV